MRFKPGCRPVSWLLVGTAAVCASMMLYLPYAFMIRTYRFVYPNLRVYGVVFALLTVMLTSALLRAKWRSGLWPRVVTGLTGLTLGVWWFYAAMLPGRPSAQLILCVIAAAGVVAGLRPDWEPGLFHGVYLAVLVGLSILMAGYPAVPQWFHGLPVPALVVQAGLVASTIALVVADRRGDPRLRAAAWIAVAVVLEILAWGCARVGSSGDFVLHTLIAAGAGVYAVYLARPWPVPRLGDAWQIPLLTGAFALVPVYALGAVLVWGLQLQARDRVLGQLKEQVVYVKDQLRQIPAEVSSNISAQSLQEILRSRAVGMAGTISVLPEGAEPARWPKGMEGWFEEALPSGDRVVTAFSRHQGLGVTIVVTRPAMEAYSPTFRLSIAIFLGVTLLAAAAVGLSLIIARRISRRMSAIRSLAEAVSRGQYEARIPDANFHIGGFGELGEALNTMAHRLGEYAATVDAQKNELVERAARQETLIRLGNLVLHSHRAQPVIESAVRETAARLGLRFCAVLEVLPDQATFALGSTAGAEVRLPAPHELLASHPTLRQAMLSRRPAMVCGAPPTWAPGGLGLLAGADVLSGFCVPICGLSQMHGVLLGLAAGERSFTNRDAVFLEGLVGAMAAALDRERLNRRSAAEHGVTHLLAGARRLEEAIPGVLQAVCREMDWQAGVFWAADGEDGRLRCLDVWHVPALEGAALFDVVRGTLMDTGMEMAGTQRANWSSTWSAAAENFPQGAAAVAAGLRGAICVPVRASSEIAGVMEFFSSEMRHLDDETRVSMEAVASQVGQFIQRSRAEWARELLLTEEQAEKGRKALLADAIALLDASLEPQELLDRIVRFPLPQLADWAVVYPAVSGLDAVVAHVDPQKESLARTTLALYGPTPERDDGSFAIVNDTGRPHLVAPIPREEIEQRAENEEHLQALKMLMPRASVLVPLRARHRHLGFLSLVIAESDRRWNDRDLALIEDLAGRIALALDNARLRLEVQETLGRLEESHALLDTLIDTAPVGFGVLDPNLRYMRINPALAAIHGRPQADHLGRRIEEILPGMARVTVPAMQRVLETGEPVINAELGDIFQGGRRHLMGSIYPVRLRDGNVIGVGTIVSDFTDRKRMENALRASERLLADKREVFEQIATGGPLPDILQRVARFVENRIGHGHCAIHLRDDRGEMRLVAAPTLPEGFSRSLERMPVQPAIETAVPPVAAGAVALLDQLPPFDIQATVSGPIIGSAGEVVGTVTVYGARRRKLQDSEIESVTVGCHMASIAIERHRLEEGGVQKLHSLIRNMAEGVVAVDEGMNVLFANPAAEHLLDLPQVTGYARLDDLDLPEALRLSLAEAAAPGATHPQRIAFAMGDMEIEAHVSPVFTELGRYGAMAVMQDVTREKQLRRLQESFVANVSHELRGPLASLSATLEAMADGLIAEEARPRFLRAMLVEMDRLRRLSREVVDLAQMDSGAAHVERCEVELAAIFEQCFAKSYQRCAASGVELLVDQTLLTVVGDPDRIDQVLTNFVDNAVRFTPEGGQIRVFAGEVGSMVRISVADSGSGVPAEHLPYIWERFYKVDAARTLKPGSGTGLGLAIARQLVELMGGAVEVESHAGVGSTFSFLLPDAESGR